MEGGTTPGSVGMNEDSFLRGAVCDSPTSGSSAGLTVPPC